MANECFRAYHLKMKISSKYTESLCDRKMMSFFFLASFPIPNISMANNIPRYSEYVSVYWCVATYEYVKWSRVFWYIYFYPLSLLATQWPAQYGCGFIFTALLHTYTNANTAQTERKNDFFFSPFLEILYYIYF